MSNAIGIDLASGGDGGLWGRCVERVARLTLPGLHHEGRSRQRRRRGGGAGAAAARRPQNPPRLRCLPPLQGTTYSCVGVWQHDRVEIIPNEQVTRCRRVGGTACGLSRYAEQAEGRHAEELSSASKPPLVRFKASGGALECSGVRACRRCCRRQRCLPFRAGEPAVAPPFARAPNLRLPAGCRLQHVSSYASVACASPLLMSPQAGQPHDPLLRGLHRHRAPGGRRSQEPGGCWGARQLKTRALGAGCGAGGRCTILRGCVPPQRAGMRGWRRALCACRLAGARLHARDTLTSLATNVTPAPRHFNTNTRVF